MKLVIDISEELYEDIKYNFEKKYYCDCGGYLISSTIVNGTPFEEELEKLKEEVENLCFVTYSMDGNTMFDITKGEIIYRINKHIEELKGEK